VQAAARLSCTTPELADVWNDVFPDSPWTYDSAERDPWRRAELRAEIDAIVADLYGLSVEQYARILTSFPLLDRGQPPLDGDFFLTEGKPALKHRFPDGQGTKWVENDAGIFELEPRSFITRDFALLTYMIRKHYEQPLNLADWYTSKVGLDPVGPLSRFRIGPVREIGERVAKARAAGAVPNIPTGRGGLDQDGGEEEPD
jgi:hypothetical protein